ncbi:hypothetical protein BS50DRAFT_639292 [Corynespora cassiicola Philippines]|uniref:F-box domain-containing protein n=1 Tax=Corynespora cassiicola Philippines TaxID=1448308 RepID=A0A2T2N8X5_CORCC|nr:hypothetical protein BS50DRAFT_639292 [Corynespora cassiicola Philippines]
MIQIKTRRSLDIDNVGRAVRRLHALDRLLAATPTAQHAALDLDVGRLDVDVDDVDYIEDSVHGDRAAKLLELLFDRQFHRPELIPGIYMTAYREVLDGRPFVNRLPGRHDRIRTASELFELLPAIDELLGTSHAARFDGASSQVKPFAFLNLPPELRLEVYSHLIPSTVHLKATRQEAGNPFRPPSRVLNIRATCRLLNAQVIRFVFQRCALVVNLSRPMPQYVGPGQSFVDSHVSRLSARDSIRTIKFNVPLLFDCNPRCRCAKAVRLVETGALYELVRLFPRLDAALVWFKPLKMAPWTEMAAHEAKHKRKTAKRAIRMIFACLLPSVQLRYWFERFEDEDVKDLVAARMQERGAVYEGVVGEREPVLMLR